MRLLVLGATGPTGRRLVGQALAAGHEVTALVRNPAKMPAADPRLTVVRGDATRIDDVGAAARGADAVLVALGSGKSIHSDIASRSTAALVPALEAVGVARVIVLSAYGVGDTAADAGLVMRLAYRVAMRSLFADKARADDALRASGLEWTLVYAVSLTDGPRTGSYAAHARLKSHGMPRISRADVAEFMLAQVQDTTWLRRTVILGG